MRAYYNEIDAFAVQWLRNLANAGHISSGHVDERSIRDVKPENLVGYARCHFFAGIGVWDYALRLAGWPDDEPVWTGSCPCQPFSSAGRRKSFDDERHLWPEWFRLIKECRPPVVFGEQVAGPDGYAWLDAVQESLETTGYAVGAVVLPAAGFGAPHGRHRIFFVADADGKRRLKGCVERLHTNPEHDAQSRSDVGRMGKRPTRPSPTNGFWRDADWLFCRDNKWRPVEPNTFPLAHGASARVGRLLAYGNAIVAPVAAEFVRAYLEIHKP